MTAAITMSRARTTLVVMCVGVFAGLVPVTAGAVGAAVARGCPNAGLPATVRHARTVETAVICEVNRYRAASGLRTVHAAPRLTRSAGRFARRLVKVGRLDHYLAGTSPRARARAAGYGRWRSVDFEDLAEGQKTAAEVVGAWYASPPHHAVLLAPARHIGAGFHAGYWVLDLGRR